MTSLPVAGGRIDRVIGREMTVDGCAAAGVGVPPGTAAALRRYDPLPLPHDALVTGRIFGALPVPVPATPPPVAGPVAGRAGAATPMAVLEAAVLVALQRPPCVVTFSGGMDSTFVLAVALRVARRHGLPLPIPVSWRFPQVPKADESAVQDELLGELGVGERLVWPVSDELDMIGPVASRLLVRYGPVFPANMHLHLPMMELCRGGSVLTGWGGDQVLGAWSRQRWPHPRAVLRSGWTALPRSVRGLLPRTERARPVDFPWLTPAAATRFARKARREQANGWGRPDRRLAWHLRNSGESECSHNLAAVGAGENVLMVSPLYDPAFLDALTAMIPQRDVLSRGELITAISGGLLPAAVSAKRPKAWFGEVLRRGSSTEFVRSWDGTGIESVDVDIEALQRQWVGGVVPQGTELLVQQAWTHHLRRADSGSVAGPAAGRAG